MLSLLLRTLLAVPQQRISNVQHATTQSILTPHDATGLGENNAVPNRFTKVEQDDSVCAAGSRQWTGKIEVTHGNELFYWYFESQQFAERAPLLIWLTGGPGEACTVPLLNGGGPCTINDDGTATVNSPHSWTNFSLLILNPLFLLSEIAGVGFSKSNSKPVHRPKTIDDVTLDLKYFLSTFVSEAFPELRGRGFHISGESYGGIQAISLAYALANPETGGPQPDLSLESLVASSSFADISYSAPAYYDVLCGRDHQYLNRTECAIMAAAVPTCETAAVSCRQTTGDEHCWAMAAACAPILQFWVPPEKNIVHLEKPCAGFPTCDPRMKAIETYMNNTEIQKKLGFAKNHLVPFVGMDMEVNIYMAMHGSVWLPTSSKYEYLLKNTSVRILGRGGYLDPDTPIEGAIRGFEAFHWWGQAQFRASRPEPWYYRGTDGDMVRGGWRRGYSRLWFVSFDQTGHLIDRDEPESSLHIMKQWIQGGVPVQA
ncbi:hypothetical protein PFICI_11822 [Pestalotiopsis fici W106-1]|uniref:Carboxypeptidase n=1 Tax=Pestalotiopsis fici (strain W106-1 / CGMCC3.15140) TaxID=1229662 RepID=W3WRE2_PESFW|nr:uncharacterized protein PFICI_11822 [Pestalotiopsis fici W106-1]ETS76435.1 hypothetical protein PFICI_11822 [Pestalotiopsis fici W106-1]